MRGVGGSSLPRSQWVWAADGVQRPGAGAGARRGGFSGPPGIGQQFWVGSPSRCLGLASGRAVGGAEARSAWVLPPPERGGHGDIFQPREEAWEQRPG